MHPIKTRLSILFALLLLLPCAASAQEALQERMTPAEFKAAGLEKLSAEELAALNAWLQSRRVEESRRVASETRKEVEQENRGFFDFGSSEPVVSRLKGEFTGFGNGRRYLLENGQEWRQVDNATLYGVRRSNPEMTIRPSLIGNAWYLTVEGYNTRTKVQRIK